MRLGGVLLVDQAPLLDRLSLDALSVEQDGLAAVEVDIGRGQVAQALVVAVVIVVGDEGVDLRLEVAGQLGGYRNGLAPCTARRISDLRSADRGRRVSVRCGMGFSFVALDTGGGAFLHISALQRSGLPSLTEGQAVKLHVNQGKKGPEVETLDIDSVVLSSRNIATRPRLRRSRIAGLLHASADHFGTDPDEVPWSETAWLTDATAKLKDVADPHRERRRPPQAPGSAERS